MDESRVQIACDLKVLEEVMQRAKQVYCHGNATLTNHGYINYEFNAKTRLSWLRQALEHHSSQEQLLRHLAKARITVYQFVHYIGETQYY